MESLFALSRGLEADGLIWVSGYDFYGLVPIRRQVRHVVVPKLFVAGESDTDAAALLPVFDRVAPSPKEIVLLATGSMGPRSSHTPIPRSPMNSVRPCSTSSVPSEVGLTDTHDAHRAEFHGRRGGALLHRLTRTPGLVRARSPFRPSRLLPFLLAFALASSACTSGPSPETDSTSRIGRVAELRSISELRERFNEDSGKVRLILLISPT
jgi:hypothetical protein